MPSQDPAAGARSRPGRGGGLAQGRVSEIQRRRILAAMADVTAERGIAAVTVAHVVARAGVSRRTFYELFEDREACFLAAFDDAVARLAAIVVAAYADGAPGRPWRERVRAALLALLGALDSEPGVARLCVVEALAAGPQALEHRARVVAALVAAIDEGRAAGGDGGAGREPPPLTAEGVVGAVLSVLHTRVLAGGPREPGGLTGLLGPLMGMIVLPYLGPAAARGELARPAPRRRGRAAGIARDPLDGLDMRLTYRTVRVLIAIAAHPRASNRQVAEAAGIADQGQISKLLARLADLGLAHNGGAGAVKGAPNAWLLTAKGEQIERAIRAQTTSG